MRRNILERWFLRASVRDEVEFIGRAPEAFHIRVIVSGAARLRASPSVRGDVVGGAVIAAAIRPGSSAKLPSAVQLPG